MRVLSTEQSVGIKAMYTTSANIAFSGGANARKTRNILQEYERFERGTVKDLKGIREKSLQENMK